MEAEGEAQPATEVSGKHEDWRVLEYGRRTTVVKLAIVKGGSGPDGG